MTYYHLSSIIIQYLPDLLIEILAPKHHLSLERMQLLTLSMKIQEPLANGIDHLMWRDKNIIKNIDDTIILSGNLSIKNNIILSINLTYFLRGSKQYYQHKIIKNNMIKIKPLTIDNHITTLLNLNTYKNNQELARLQGYKISPLSPLTLIYSMINEIDIKKNLMIYFYRSGFINDNLILVKDSNEHHKTYGIMNEEHLLAMAIIDD